MAAKLKPKRQAGLFDRKVKAPVKKAPKISAPKARRSLQRVQVRAYTRRMPK